MSGFISDSLGSREQLSIIAKAASTNKLTGAGGSALGALPEPNQTEDEVSAFVESLLRNGRIALPRRRTRASVAADQDEPQPTTHAIRSSGNKKVLVRIRFLCGGR